MREPSMHVVGVHKDGPPLPLLASYPKQHEMKKGQIQIKALPLRSVVASPRWDLWVFSSGAVGSFQHSLRNSVKTIRLHICSGRRS